MSGGAPKEVFALLAPKFEQQTGNKVRFTYAVITELREKLSTGATADVLVLPTPVLHSLAKDGKVRADSRATFGTVGISAVVKEGAPRPDISSEEKFRAAMLAARSIVHATPGKTPSGTDMGKVMEQLDIADAMAKKVILKPALDGGVQLVVAGQAEIGIYPTSEVAGVKGLTVVGPLPNVKAAIWYSCERWKWPSRWREAMDRREFIKIACGLVGAWPLAAEAQQPTDFATL